MIAMMLLDLFQVLGEDIETNFLFLCRHIAPQCRWFAGWGEAHPGCCSPIKSPDLQLSPGSSTHWDDQSDLLTGTISTYEVLKKKDRTWETYWKPWEHQKRNKCWPEHTWTLHHILPFWRPKPAADPLSSPIGLFLLPVFFGFHLLFIDMFWFSWCLLKVLPKNL